MSKIRAELRRLFKKHGPLTPEIVVNEASDPNSPLHNSFEWDNEKAAEFIRSVRIKYTGKVL